jgi:hypothetical protein
MASGQEKIIKIKKNCDITYDRAIHYSSLCTIEQMLTAHHGAGIMLERGCIPVQR